jgi:hypothetical protein
VDDEPARDVGDQQGAAQDAWRAQARVAWQAELVTTEQAARLAGVVRSASFTRDGD